MTPTYAIPLPPADSWGTPTAKMPHCPQCGCDELGLIEPDRGVCYVCNAVVVRKPDWPGARIEDTPAVCGICPWLGIVLACDAREDGELLCPQCGAVIVVKVEG